MGCETSLMKKEGTKEASDKDKPRNGNVKADTGGASSKDGISNSNGGGDNTLTRKTAEGTPPGADPGKSPKEDPHESNEPCVSDPLIAGMPATHVSDPDPQPPTINGDPSHSDSCATEELNGSFSIDLAGSFRVPYSNKGDIILDTKVLESRRSRFVSPSLLMAMSPHPSDNDLVLICIDCGMEIRENCELVLCPLTGKSHV
ncbi:hypothetical protein Q4I32_006531 [Leishmania shawi]|uniref:Uncharacterized protein n=1 Tax=Leishmania shawi TaxID=5680 RepID=A0AAW3BF07_9TRYP